MLTDNVLGNLQAQPAAVWPPADHRIKNSLQIAGVDAWSVVDYVQAHDLSVTGFTDGELPGYPCLQGNLGSVGID